LGALPLKPCRVVVASAFFCAGLVRADGSPPEAFSAVDQRNLRAVALKVQEAILNENVNELARAVSRTEGLTCTDARYSYKSVQSFLHDKTSHLYMSLFDSARFSRQCGYQYSPEYPAISDREFLRTGNESIVIARLDNDWAQVTITSSVKGLYPREWYFHREERTWRLARGSFVLGRCSCG
jgi:hypothetical protein